MKNAIRAICNVLRIQLSKQQYRVKPYLQFFTLFLFGLNTLLAQNNLNSKDRQVLQTLMEKLSENAESGIDFSDLQTRFEERMLHKLNLNKATESDLIELYFLKPNEIKALLNHKQMYGPFLSIYELQAVEGLDEQSIQFLNSFTAISESKAADYEKIGNMLKKGKHEFIYLHEQELQTRKGYLPPLEPGANHYLGSPYREVLRYRFFYANRLALGYSGEKDMGEPLGSNPLNFFDFNSVYLFYKGKGMLKNIAIGNYQANFGKGLTFGTGISARKSALVLNGGNLYETLRPYRSINESGFLQGAAVTIGKKQWSTTVFVSSKKISSTLSSDTLNDAQTISSIALNGLHRTATEIAKKDNSIQQITGFNIEYQKAGFKLGAVFVVSKYNFDLVAKVKPYQYFLQPQALLQNRGIYGQYQFKSIIVTGEFAQSSSNGNAFFAELLMPLHSKADFMCIYRNYQPQYQSIFTNVFSEYGGANNEQGCYMALMLKPMYAWQIALYADVFQSPWLRYLVNAPSHGKEFLINSTYTFSKTLQLECRYKFEQKPRNISDTASKIDYPELRQRQQIRFQLNYAITRELTFKTRFEQVLFDKYQSNTQTGTLFFQDVHAKIFHSKLGITTRLAWFDMDSYDARVYATESDVLYNYAIPQFQNRGWRCYLILNYKLNKKTELYLKYGQSTYSNINTIGTGLEQINGNKLQELKVQVRVVL